MSSTGDGNGNGNGNGEPGYPIPDLPPGREIELDERGTVFVRDVGPTLADPATAPTIVLLHGWTATADLNFFTCYSMLAERHRVIAFDHRGHGRGIRSRKPFRLEDCADDAVDVADALGAGRFIVYGYSMGGAIAQLAWRRHPDRVSGLVLGSTAPYFAGRRQERWSFLGHTGLAALARLTPEQTRAWITDQFYLQRKAGSWEPWAIDEASRHEWRLVLEAGRAIGGFSSSPWLCEIDVPTSVVVTMKDRVVPIRRQARLVETIPGAVPFRVLGDHDAVVAQASTYVPTLRRAVASVVARQQEAATP